MAKDKKNKRPSYKLNDGSIPALITEHLTKKGRLKASNKKDYKILRGACVHHVISHKGKLRATVQNNGKRECYCRTCNYAFPTTPYEDKVLDSTIDGIRDLNNQAKFMNTAIGGGQESQRYFSEFGSMIELYKKLYQKLLSVAKKADGLKKKKNKGKKTSAGSTYGSWK